MKEGGDKRVLISTIYEGYAVKQAITKLSPDKLIFLIDEPLDIKKKEKMNSIIKEIKDFFKDTIEFQNIKISSYDIPKIMAEVIKVIDEEYKEGNKIFIHASEGRKPTSFALLFASYRRRDKVEGDYYITEEEHTLIKLPMLNFEIRESKKLVLKEIEKGNLEVEKIGKKLGLKQSVIYQNIQGLKEEGYVSNENKELRLTDLGRVMIL